MSESLASLRRRLDELDVRLIELLAERQQIVDAVALSKRSDADRVRDVPREEDLLTRVVQRGKEAGLDGFYVTRLFREILDHSVRRQQAHFVEPSAGGAAAESIVVAHLGADGSYSHQAALRHFGPQSPAARYKGFETFPEMLEAVRDGGATHALLPIENTSAGSINEAYDLLARMDLSLIGEEVIRVDHCLLALGDVPLGNIRRIYSHPKALDQCTQFLAELDDCHVESVVDTASAARRIRDEQDLSQAAIASQEAARLYGLTIIRRGVANQKENFTRFVVVSAAPVRVDARVPCKTSVVFATKHEEGALLKCLNVLASHHLNLTKLESRPRPNTPWEYLFYVDFEGNLAAEDVQEAMHALASQASFLKVLGSYPARTTRENRPADPRPAELEITETPTPPAAPPAVLKSLEKAPYRLVSRAQRADDTRIAVGPVVFGGPKPVLIAGPCSVESREQILACARVVKEMGGDLLRGGCFKPRTSPYAFQGLGYEGLDLLEEAGRTFGLPIVTEVLHPADVERVARQSDVIQLGARNMQNFSLLKEVGKVDRPVLLKRGMMSSIDEWLAAAEYILAQGNQQVILCERGIRTFETATRNTLDLSAIPVVRERTHLPVIVDPSHAVGTWRWVAPMAAAAISVGAHGLMIEIHPDPDKALSDGPQSLSFETFRRLMLRLRGMPGGRSDLPA